MPTHPDAASALATVLAQQTDWWHQPWRGDVTSDDTFFGVSLTTHVRPSSAVYTLELLVPLHAYTPQLVCTTPTPITVAFDERLPDVFVLNTTPVPTEQWALTIRAPDAPPELGVDYRTYTDNPKRMRTIAAQMRWLFGLEDVL